ncbi:MAG: T9SS type A sorting domain-containing protein [Rubricoccaceae bacterium]|nr:T9SS type A sorting domain-containing protein [Rubricoccaceae bacterium]
MRLTATTGLLLAVFAFMTAPAAFAQGTQPSEILDTGTLQFEFFDNGELGTDVGVGTGLVFNGAENALFEGTFLVGTGFDAVCGEAYEAPAYEWINTAAITASTPPMGFDEAYVTGFDCSGGPLAIDVTAEAYAGSGDPYVINDFLVQNSSGGDLNGVSIGIFADFDVSSANFAQNLCDYDDSTQLLYCWDPTGDNTNYYGIAAIDYDDMDGDVTVTGVSYDALPGDAILYGGLTVIQSPPGAGADRRTVLGIGPFDLADGETQRAVFAWVAGADETEVIANAQAAQDEFGDPVAIEPLPDGTPGTHALSAPAPNPTNARTAFTLEVAQTQPVRVALYDALGREVSVLHDAPLAAGSEHRFTVDTASLPAGVYLIRAAGEQFNATRTVSLTR